MILRPEDGCTSDFPREGKPISLSPGTKVTIGASLTRSKENITVDEEHAQLWWKDGDVCCAPQIVASAYPNHTSDIHL